MILEIIFLKKVSFSGVAPDLAGVVWNGAALCNGGMLSGQNDDFDSFACDPEDGAVKMILLGKTTLTII